VKPNLNRQKKFSVPMKKISKIKSQKKVNSKFYKSNFQQTGHFSLPYRMATSKFLKPTGLASAQIVIVIHKNVVISARLTTRFIILNGQRGPLNQNGMASSREMCAAVDFCCMQTTNYSFSLPEKAFY
jgi:hypothetical protein